MERVIVQTHEFLRQLSVFPSAEELLMVIEKEVLEELKKAAQEREFLPGTGGMSKLRVALEGHGKRSSVRVIYLDFPAKEVVYLLMVYSKNRQENISKSQKGALKKKSKEFKS